MMWSMRAKRIGDKDAKAQKEYLKGEIKRLEYEERAERQLYMDEETRIQKIESRKKIKELKADKALVERR